MLQQDCPLWCLICSTSQHSLSSSFSMARMISWIDASSFQASVQDIQVLCQPVNLEMGPVFCVGHCHQVDVTTRWSRSSLLLPHQWRQLRLQRPFLGLAEIPSEPAHKERPVQSAVWSTTTTTTDSIRHSHYSSMHYSLPRNATQYSVSLNHCCCAFANETITLQEASCGDRGALRCSQMCCKQLLHLSFSVCALKAQYMALQWDGHRRLHIVICQTIIGNGHAIIVAESM